MIAQVENAIIAALEAKADAGVLGYSWRTLDSYPDDFDAYLKQKGALRTPAAWAVFLGMADGHDDESSTGWEGEARFALIVAAENLRNETASRHGSVDVDGVPGSYQLAIDAVRILTRNWLEPLGLVRPISVTGMRLVSRTPEIIKQKLSLMAIELRCRLPIGLFDGGELDDFRTFHADWDVPSFGNVTPPLPAEDPDAADTVELEQ